MPVDPKDRERYEHGIEVNKSDLFSKFLNDMLSTALDSESEKEAYNKARRGEQLDEDKDDSSSSRSSGCFLTTACVQTLGLPDDCAELTALRQFRDSYVLSTEEGQAEIREYYAVAPGIVRAISSRPDANRIYWCIYENLITPCVRLIQQGALASAYQLYGQWFRRLTTDISSVGKL